MMTARLLTLGGGPGSEGHRLQGRILTTTHPMHPPRRLPLVRYVGGTWRVGGLLALSRAFGDAYMKGSLQVGGAGWGEGEEARGGMMWLMMTWSGCCKWQAGCGRGRHRRAVLGHALQDSVRVPSSNHPASHLHLSSNPQFEGIPEGSDGYSSGFGVIAEPYTEVTTLTGEGAARSGGASCLGHWAACLGPSGHGPEAQGSGPGCSHGSSCPDVMCMRMHVIMMYQKISHASFAILCLHEIMRRHHVPAAEDKWLIVASDGLFAEEERGGGGGLDNKGLIELLQVGPPA